MNNSEITVQQPHPYPDSYYVASADIPTPRSSLSESIETDICIVGAGYTGLSTGLFLAEKGCKAVIVEASRVGWGAAGRNGGHLTNGFSGGMEYLEKALGKDKSDSFSNYHYDGTEIVKDFIKRYDIDCDLKFGQIHTAYTKKHMKGLEAHCRLLESYGIHSLSMLDKAETRKKVGSDVYLGGVSDQASGHLHPLKLALGEAAAFENLGGKIFEQSPMMSIERQGSAIMVRTSHGLVRAKKVLLCGEAYLGNTVQPLAKRVMPASTQVMATRPLDDEMLKEVLPADTSVADCRNILDYFRLSADKRMIFGGGVVYGGTTPADIEKKLRRNMEKVFPQLKGIQVDYAWSGNMAITSNRYVQVGELEPNVYFAHGFAGHGLNNTHSFGRIMADVLVEKRDEYEAFAKVPSLSFPGGQQFRVPYSVAGSWWYGLRDYLGV